MKRTEMYSSPLLILSFFVHFLVLLVPIDAYIGANLSWCTKCRRLIIKAGEIKRCNKASSSKFFIFSPSALSSTNTAVNPNELKLVVRKAKNWMEIYKALEVYRCKFNHLYVDRGFVVPNNDSEWPKHIHGLKLGEEVFLIRSTLKYVKDNYQRIMLLKKLGFDFKADTNKSMGFQEKAALFESTLKTHKELYDDLDIDENFVIPSQLPWEEKYWGVKLGLIIKDTLASCDVSSPERYLRLRLLCYLFWIFTSVYHQSNNSDNFLST